MIASSVHPAEAGKPGAEESKQLKKDVLHNPGDAPHLAPTWSRQDWWRARRMSGRARRNLRKWLFR